MSDLSENARLRWPATAVVTAGMPYGNKPLHFGHIGGVFVPADAFARFLRDRIGAENVRFVSGTDCYGSPINEGYRKACEEQGFQGTIADYVQQNHERQAATLRAFDVSLDIFEGSGIGHGGEVHQELTDELITRLWQNGWLKLDSTLQFYDTQAETFLNGRQVLGSYCPVQGCKAERAYADECDLGHSYAPEDLPNPRSTLTDTVPEMRSVMNWYFDLPAFGDVLRERVKQLQADPEVRPLVPQAIAEFLAPPIIFVKNEAYERYLEVRAQLPEHEQREAEKGKASFEIEFASIEARDEARKVLAQANIRFRTSKTLVPFRITGNIEWGVKAPVLDGVEGLTVWCWPESLWAPISFTIACNDERGLPREAWRDFWCAPDSCIYQFIGQDNLYFYGVAQPALWQALRPGGLFAEERGAEAGVDDEPLRQTKLVANHHLLFGKTKASSSGAVKPPTGEELLEHYTAEQLRAHFLALGLDQKAVGFSPKPFEPDEEKRNDPRVADPALKEGALLTNVFNRLARSCFYEAQKSFDGLMPLDAPTISVVERARETLRAYDGLMHRVELHSVMSLMDEFIRYGQKWWADGIKAAEAADDEVARKQVLCDSFFLLRVATLLMHPVVPRGCELICEMLDFSATDFFSWNYDFDGNAELCTAEEIAAGAHLVKELPARFDFFKKHPSQFKA